MLLLRGRVKLRTLGLYRYIERRRKAMPARRTLAISSKRLGRLLDARQCPKGRFRNGSVWRACQAMKRIADSDWGWARPIFRVSQCNASVADQASPFRALDRTAFEMGLVIVFA